MRSPGGRNDSRGLLHSACQPLARTPFRSVGCDGTGGHDGTVRSLLKRWKGDDTPGSPSRWSRDTYRNHSRTSRDARRFPHGMSRIGARPRLVPGDLPSVRIFRLGIPLSSWKGAGQPTDRLRIPHLPTSRAPSLLERRGPFASRVRLRPDARDDKPCSHGRTRGTPAQARSEAALRLRGKRCTSSVTLP